MPRISRLRIATFIIVLEAAILFPIAYSPWLRFDYTQTLSRWAAKAIPPNTVHIGDSITAGGRGFNSRRDINLGASGLLTYQIASLIPKALSFHPNHIAIMAGANDAIAERADLTELRGLWQSICKIKGVVVTLATPTSSDVYNSRIAQINRVVRRECAPRSVIDLAPKLADRRGRIQARYTVDGVHLSDDALEIWSSALAKFGV